MTCAYPAARQGKHMSGGSRARRRQLAIEDDDDDDDNMQQSSEQQGVSSPGDLSPQPAVSSHQENQQQ